MNDNSLTATTASLAESPRDAVAKQGFYGRLVLGIFEKMRNGCLHLRLPDGSERILGGEVAGPHAKFTVHSEEAFRRCVLFGDIGLGEGYVDGLWDTPDITAVIAWFTANLEQSALPSDKNTLSSPLNLLGTFNRILHLLRPNTRTISRKNISEHYDLGNSFYQLWLDETMTYSSALFSRPEMTLQEAQTEKYDALCRILKLRKDDHLLEIGTGWGGMCEHAATHYGCRVTSVTISREQHEFARARMQRTGLSERVDVRFCDYRDLTGAFDKIVSIEMLEAVGDKFLPSFFRQANHLLKKDGLMALQFITIPDCKYESLRRNVDWIQKHIFPGSLLLSLGRINDVLRQTGALGLHTLNDMGDSYARTLRLWRERFNAAEQEVSELGFDTAFKRKWNYYLSYCEAGFLMRNISVVQALYTRPCNTSLSSTPYDILSATRGHA